jgi:hypothetical protein
MTWSEHVLNAQLLPPDINCSQVDINGESSIIWSPLNDPNGEFVAYHIFASVSGGPFNEIAQINTISTSTFVDNINDAALDEICYYIVLQYFFNRYSFLFPLGICRCGLDR